MRRRLQCSVMVLTIVTGLVITWLINRGPVSPCDNLLAARYGKHRFVPLQLVVQPWKGPHHVYGVFKIPRQYKVHRLYSATLIIEGTETVFAAGSPENEEVAESVTAEEYYIRRAYIPTRIALWFLFTGRFGNLKSECHWSLIYADRRVQFQR